MRILGIDPGLGITGYGLIELDNRCTRLLEAGVVRTNPNSKIEKRLLEIYKKIINLINDTKPDVAVLEELYSHYKHPRTSILMGHARGVISLAVEEKGVELVNYPSTKVKKAITGRGHASKSQIQRTVVNVLNINRIPEPADVTDALALALTHANVYMHNQSTVKARAA
ncbi:MAG: crossover junction endodeoxyribonuclease RuvC [Candidatus Omnitrophota bacterium]